MLKPSQLPQVGAGRQRHGQAGEKPPPSAGNLTDRQRGDQPTATGEDPAPADTRLATRVE